MKLWYGMMVCAPFLLLMGKACGPSIPPDPPEPPIPEPTADPEPLPPSEYSCATACENQRHLGCELGQPTVEGSTCEEVCGVSSSAGVRGLEWDVEGLTQAKECGE